MAESVPVIDFAAYNLDRTDPDSASFQQLVDEVHQALTTFGFMCIKNTGIPSEKVFSLSRLIYTTILSNPCFC